MSEVDVQVESPPDDTPVIETEELAEALANAQLEVAHTLEQEAAVEEAQAVAEIALGEATSHIHSEYAEMGHSHPESDYSERISGLETRLASLEESLTPMEETTVEEIEPVATPAPEPETKRKGLRMGR